MSLFLGSWGMNRSAEQTNRPRTASRFTRFVCPVLRFIPHEPRKKDTHSLIEHVNYIIRKALTTLDHTRSDAKVMKKAIKSLSGKFEEAKKNTSGLLRQLTVKATALEKLKAKCMSGTDLEAHMRLYVTESDEEEEEDLLLQGRFTQDW